MKYLFIILFTLIPIFLFCQTDTTADQSAGIYQEDKLISMQVRKRFDPLYPLDVKDFYFYQGTEEISFEQLSAITGDDLLLKNEKRIKRTRRGGIAGAIILGSISTIFLIPSVSFVVIQTNWDKFYTLTSQYNSYIKYWDENYDKYWVPGIVTSILTMLSTVGVIIDLAVMFTLIHKYKNNEKLYKRAIEKYNKQVKQKYTPRPDLGFNSSGTEEQLVFSLKISI